MPRTTTSAAPETDSLVAAAIAYPGAGSNRITPVKTEGWQKEVWDLWDEVGEFRYGTTWSANVASRATLRVGHRDDNGDVTMYPLSDPKAKLLAEVTGGMEGQPAFIKALTLNLTVAGEAYIVNRKVHPDDPIGGALSVSGGRMWEVVGTEEIDANGDQWWLNFEGGRRVPLTEKDTVIRVWNQHPKNRFLATSASKSALPILREIRRMDMHISAQTDSRLTGSGLLFLPSEITVKPPAGVNKSLTGADLVVTTLVQAASAHKVGIGTAEAQVPIVFTAPGEVIKNIKHIKLWSDLDAKATDMRDNALSRLATTLDLPKEIITGTSDMNRWGAWQVEESSVKAHVEPGLADVVFALTTQLIQPITGDLNDVVVYDTATLRLRPNRSKEAIELYDRGLLGPTATIRETGFLPGDMPNEEERREWMLMQMVKASWSPDQAQAAARGLGLDLGIPLPGDNEPRQARPTPSLNEHPTRDAPERSVSVGDFPDVSAEAAVAATLAWRAMERAGNRLRTLTGSKPDQPIHNTHVSISVWPDRVDDLLKGSFDDCGTFGLTPAMVDRTRHLCREHLLRGLEFTYQSTVHALSGQ